MRNFLIALLALSSTAFAAARPTRPAAERATPAAAADMHAVAVGCHFAPDSVYTNLVTAGQNGSFVSQGSVAVPALTPYNTGKVVDVAVWVDDSMMAATPEAAALALRYFEHANCIFAMGRNKDTNAGNHSMSFRLAGNRIRYYKINTPPVANGQVWIQQAHWDWKQSMSQLAGMSKVNLLITSRSWTDTGDGVTWNGVGGASNGVGQGQALANVDSRYFKNGMTVNGIARPHAEDWWGVIAAHELGHAMGQGGHVVTHYDTMCCSGADYPGAERGTIESRQFALSDQTWNSIKTNDSNTADNYPDPYANKNNPVTHVKWNFLQISGFLKNP